MWEAPSAQAATRADTAPSIPADGSYDVVEVTAHEAEPTPSADGVLVPGLALSGFDAVLIGSHVSG